jgi:CheY-like chemotaxis protein
VLINLLSNAVKFTKEGPVTLRVSSKATSQPTRFLLLFEVTDTGVGIASCELESVFEAFVQTSSGQQLQGGTGLGMPISRAFVQMMGGSLTLTSEVGVGTIFRFDIPVESTTQPRRQAGQVRRTTRFLRIGLEPNQHAADGGPYRLLVVEDQHDNRQLLVKLLSSLGPPPQGFEVRTAANGKEAIEIWEQWEPHLIWMDMRMPVMDGLEATRRIKAAPQGKETIIVALTAFAFAEDQARMLAEGCDDYVRKPFRDADIFAVLAKHLNVRFIYESIDEIERARSQEQETKETDMAPLLAAMPSEWLDDLRQAALIGDFSGMVAFVAQIREQGSPGSPNEYLADRLTELIDGFKWDEILMLIPKAAKN